MMGAEDVVVFLRAQIGEFSGKMSEAGGQMKALDEQGSGHFSKLASVGKAALLGIAGVAIAVGGMSIKMADEFEGAHARLEVALQNTGTNFNAVKGNVDALVKSGAGFGYNATTVQGALAQMTTGLGSSSKAFGAFGVVEDLAAAKHVSLADAALAVTKGMEGFTKPLKQMGIDLPIAAGGAVKVMGAQVALVKSTAALQAVEESIHAGRLKGVAAATALAAAHQKVTDAQAKLNTVQGSGNAILAALGQKLDGSAAAAADTFGGKVAALKATGENLFITIGLHLIPILEKLASAALATVQWFEKHRTAAIALGVVIGGVLLAAIGAFIVSLFTAGGALAFLISPITLIVAAVGLLVLAVYELVTHWSTAWSAVKNAISVAWGAIVSFFKTLPGKILDALKTIGSDLGKLFSAAWKWVATNLPHYFERAAEWWLALPVVIIGYLALFSAKLIDWATRAFLGLVTALPGIAVGAIGWFIGFVPQLIGAIAGFELKLLGWAGKSFVSLVKALPGFIADTITFFIDLPGKMIRAFGDATKILWDVGGKIIGGLLDGIKSGIGKVKDYLGGVANDIVKWKGPPTYDETILVDNGRRIMAGLRAGLTSGMGDVRSQLAGFTAEIGSNHSVVASAGRSASSGGVTVLFGDVIVQGSNLSGPELQAAFEAAVHRLTPTIVQGLVSWQRTGNGKLVDHLEHAS